MGTLLAPLLVIGLIAVGVLSVYVGGRLAGRTTHLPIRIALFLFGSICTAAVIVVVSAALSGGIISNWDIAVPTVACALIVALTVWILLRPDIFGSSDDE